MHAPAGACASEEIAHLLSRSAAAAEAGSGESAIAHATRAMALAEAAGDGISCAEAALAIACCELRLFGRFQVALEMSQRAALLFQEAQIADGESRALASAAVAASRLGYYEMAVDHAFLAVKLADATCVGKDRVLAYHALGIAMFSGKCFAEATQAYQQAIVLANHCVPPVNPFELHSDLASIEGFRYVTERSVGGVRLSLVQLETHVERCRALLACGRATNITPGSQANNLLIYGLALAHMLTWQMRLDEAAAELERFDLFRRSLDRPWLVAAANWGKTELALARRDLPEAQHWVRQMVDVARDCRHESLLQVGYHLLTHVCELAGDPAGAFSAMRLLAQREQHARAESLKGRLAIIERQVEMRAQARRMECLESDTRLYQRLALEDGLTGLANRRRFESVLTAILQVGTDVAAPVCVAMIDVDRFKQINDQFSHNVGDDVLRALGALLTSHTRDQDLPARLAGDEFVVVLREADIAAATAICDRIQTAVAGHDWSSIADALRVSISIGVTAAVAGDTLDSLTSRSDSRMYTDKRQSLAHHGRTD